MTVEPAHRATIDKEIVLRALLFVMMSIGSLSLIEPSPYEVFFLILVPVAFFGHFVLTRVTLVLFFLVIGFLSMEALALLPWLGDRPIPSEDGSGATAMVYTMQTTYLFVSALLFAVLFTRHAKARLRLALLGYGISAVLAAIWAAAAYFGVPGVKDGATILGRYSGPFKDPNVLGSYSVLAGLFFMQATMFGRRGWRLVGLVCLVLVMFGGVFLPLSRGAWGAMAFSTLYYGVVTFLTAANARMRKTLIASVAVLALLGVGAGVIVASNATLRESVTDRAKVEQNYDGGETGRFGNQKRSIMMLMERPLGFGPHRFAFYFDLDPHNSYIGAFSSAGWIGGALFFLFVVVTSAIGIRLTIVASPYMRQAQIVTPALLSAFIQGVQIDIDHWRFIYFMIGAVWGMEAARQAARRTCERPVSQALLATRGPREVPAPL